MFDFPLGVFVGLVTGIGIMCVLNITACRDCIVRHFEKKEEENESRQ